MNIQDSEFFKAAGISPEKGKDPETGRRFKSWAKVVTGVNNDSRGGGFRLDGEFVSGKSGVELDDSSEHLVLVHGHQNERNHYVLVKVVPGGQIVPVGVRVTVASKTPWATDTFLSTITNLLGAPAPAVQPSSKPLSPTVELTPGADAALAVLRPYYRNKNGEQIPDGGIAHAAFSLMGAIFDSDEIRNALFTIMKNQGGNVNAAVATAIKAFASSYDND